LGLGFERSDFNRPTSDFSGGWRMRIELAKLLLQDPDVLLLDEPTNHLDMASKDVLKEAIRAFDGTAIVVSHDREFLDGLVTKVYEFGGGKVKEHLGGIYDFLQSRNISELSQLQSAPNSPNTSVSSSPSSSSSPSPNAQSYAERKEEQKRIRKAEKAVEESERKISNMERRLKELDDLLMKPENASNMEFVTEYTSTKKALDEEVERWERLSEELENISN
jgi:ATP-binding cassette subfamily F protein 3